MTRRGRCLCGVILTFSRGAQGYKTRCPNCGAGVRLRVEPRTATTPRRTLSCPCGAVLHGVDRGRKFVCPRCQRRLRFPERPPAGQRAPEEATASTLLLDAVEANLLRFPLPDPRPVSQEVISAAASALPSRIAPAAPPRPKPAQAPVCRVCGRGVPPAEIRCRTCGKHPPVQEVLEALAVEHAPGAPVSPVPFCSPLRQREEEEGMRGQTKPQWISWQLALVVAGALSVGVVIGGVGVGLVRVLSWR